MSNVEMIAAVNRWQVEPIVHPLICRADDCRGKLVPVERLETVMLLCPECGLRQSFIPEFVLTFTGPSSKLINWFQRANDQPQA